MKRRTFMHTAGACLGGLTACLLVRSHAQWPPLPEPRALHARSLSDREVQRRILPLFVDPDAAAMIGLHYLRTYPHRNHRDRLLEEARVVVTAGSRPLRAAFDRARRDDFAAGRVVVVNGWVLAQCEAACCALLASTS